MPNLVVSLSNIESSVERPIVCDIVRQVMQITQISHRTPIRFYGDEAKAAQKNSGISHDPIAENLWEHDERLSIEIEEDFDKDRLLSTAITAPENLLIFKDAALGIIMKPVYATSDVSVRIKYRARDKNQASRWRNDIAARTSMMRSVILHELRYHYEIPEVFLVLLREVHRLRERVAGYGESFEEYFTERLTSNASVLTNLAGAADLWAVSEKQIRVQGYFEFEGVPDKPEREGDHDAWTVACAYHFKYDKPVSCNLAYPLVVHNQVLSAPYRPTERAYSLYDHQRAESITGHAFAAFETDTAALLYRSSNGVAIPNFDTFTPASIVTATVRVLMALSTVSAEEPHALFSLAELPDLALDVDVVDFLQHSEYPFMGVTYASIFCLSLYAGRNVRASGALTCSADLEIRAAAALALRTTHRVRLGLVVDLSLLSADALARLKNYPRAAIKIAKAIDAALRGCGGQPDIRKNRLSAEDYMAMGLDPHGSYTPWRGGWGGLPWLFGEGADSGAVGTGAGETEANQTGSGAYPGGSADYAPWQTPSGDPLPTGRSRTVKSNDVRWNLAQTLFVASRPKALARETDPYRTYGKSD